MHGSEDYLEMSTDEVACSHGRTESKLPVGEEVALLQPLATAPLRHAPTPAISPEALPADLLLVDILKVNAILMEIQEL